MGTGSAFNMKSVVYICLYLSTPFKTSQTYYNKNTPTSSTIDQQSTLETPGLSSGPLWAQKHAQRVPRDPQETLKIHQRGSKRVPTGSKRVPRGPQRVPNRPQMPLKWCQRGPRRTSGIRKVKTFQNTSDNTPQRGKCQ